jgi:2-iminobutanoate/2-iminopropanoate deaminase
MALFRKNFDFLDAPVGPYVHAVKQDETLYLSGITAFNTDAQTKPIEQQAEEIFRQIKLIAEAANSGLENLIKVTLFVTNFSRMEQLRQTLSNIYGQNVPASSLVSVGGLFCDELNIEVEAIISVPQ